MEVIFGNGTAEENILFDNDTLWEGVMMKHYRDKPGRLLESTRPEHRLSIPLDGECITTIHSATGKNGSYRGDRGNICLVPGTQPAQKSWENEFECLTLLIDPAFVETAADALNFSSGFEFTDIYSQEDQLVRSLGSALLEESTSETPAGRLYADSIIQTLVFHLLKKYSTASLRLLANSGGLAGYKLRRAKEFVDENLHEDIGLAQIADAAGLSRFHFARTFRTATGQTPLQYLTARRIERAKMLLAKSDMSLVDISMQTGFKNQSHFTTLFRKLTSHTPKGWRELSIA